VNNRNTEHDNTINTNMSAGSSVNVPASYTVKGSVPIRRNANPNPKP